MTHQNCGNCLFYTTEYIGEKYECFSWCKLHKYQVDYQNGTCPKWRLADTGLMKQRERVWELWEMMEI